MNPMKSATLSLGHSLVIKGHIIANEDLVISGRVEGTIELGDHVLTIADTAHIAAEIAARTVLVAGTIEGNIVATEKIEIREHGSIEGDITASRIAMSDGAQFHGRVTMRPVKADASAKDVRQFPVAV